MTKVSCLMVYPVKACKGTSLPKALVTPTGDTNEALKVAIASKAAEAQIGEVQASSLIGTGW